MDIKEFLDLLKTYSDSLLLVVVILVWGLNKFVGVPLRRDLASWEQARLAHYDTVAGALSVDETGGKKMGVLAHRIHLIESHLAAIKQLLEKEEKVK